MHLASFGDAGHYSIRCLWRADSSPSKQGCLPACHSIERRPFPEERRREEKEEEKKKEGKEEKTERSVKRRIALLFRMFQVIDESRRRSGAEFGMPYAIDRFVVNPNRV